MSFEEALSEVIGRAQGENADDEQALRDFTDRWEALRSGLVWKVFKLAEKELSKTQHGGHVRLNNGTAIILETSWSETVFTHRLKFTSRPETLEVVCSSSLEEGREDEFNLDDLTESAVEDKVKRFVYAAIRDRTRRRKMLVL